MVVSVECSRNLISRADLPWVSRACCLLCVSRLVIFLTCIKPFIFREGVSLVYLVFLNIHIRCVDGD